MIEGYLNQDAIWKRIESRDAYGKPKTITSTHIKVRWEGKRRLVRNAQGQEVVSEARAFCAEPVQPGDFINFNGKDWEVIAISEVPSLDGEVYFREVSV
jgi:hypothetical protein